MRPQHESIESETLGSVAGSLWAAFVALLQGAWIEVFVVMCALWLYLLQSKGTPSRRAKPSTASNRSDKQQVLGHPGKTPSSSLAPSSEDDKRQQMQALVVNLLQKGQQGNPMSLLQQYEDLVKVCGSSLRMLLPEDANAHSMYLALIACAVDLPISAPGGRALHRWAGRLLADMQLQGFPRSVDFYAAVLKLFTSSQHSKEALWVYDAMTEDGLKASSPMLISLLNIATTTGAFEKALAIFEDIARSSAPSQRTVMTVLRIYNANKDWKGAAKLLDRMESLGTPPDNLVLNNVLALCISVGPVDGAEQLLRRWKDATDVISCNILLKGCAQKADLAKADAVLEGMISHGPAPNIISYNTVMDCSVRRMQMLSADAPPQSRGRDAANNEAGGYHFRSQSLLAIARRPWELLDRLSSRGLEPDRYTCSTLVKGMHLAGSSAADIDRAVELLHRVGAETLQTPGASTGSCGSVGCNTRLVEVLFNTLLDACITVHDLDRMTQIFELMQDFRVSISAVTYGTLIKAFGQAGHLDRCHKVWGDMLQAHILPTIVTYGCYIDACIRNKDNAYAEKIFDSMVVESNVVQPNAVIYTSLIRGFAQMKQPRKALVYYRRMQQEGIEATSVTFNSVLDLVARQLSDPVTLQEVIDDMCKFNVVPDAITYSILTKASCNAGNIDNALAIFRKMHNAGIVLDQVACNTLLQACSKADRIEDAEDIFEAMLHLGMTPTHVTISIMVKMYGKAKMLDKAVTVSELLEKSYGQKPNMFVYTCLIRACVQNRHVRRSWEFFNKMLSTGVEPDAITYGTVIHGCVYLNKFQHAMSIVRYVYLQPQASSDDADNPFQFSSPLKKAVPLQREVLQMLSSVLRRKEQDALADELDNIAAAHVAAPSEASKGNGWKPSHRARAPNVGM